MLPNTIRIGSESDHTTDSNVGSNVRTNVRTNASDRIVEPSCNSPERGRAYEPTTESTIPSTISGRVAALKAMIPVPAPPPVTRTLDDRLAAIPPERRDPQLEQVRQQLAKETT